MNALLLIVLTQFPTDVFENKDAFTRLESKDNWVVSKRAIKDHPIAEYRVEMTTKDSVNDLCEAIYEWGTHKNDGPGVKLNKVITDGENLRVVYSQYSAPMVADRDYALTVKRERPTPETCRIRFRTTNDLAPAKPEGFVRLEYVWGEWRMEPNGEGQSKVTYTLFSEPGGSVPVFLVHGSLQDSTKKAGLQGLEKTRKWVEGGRK